MKASVWRKMSAWVRLAAAVVLVAGCGQQPPRPGGTMSVLTPDFFGIGEDLALQLAVNLRAHTPRKQRLLVATFVDLDDLEQTSRFGRALSEALANRLFRHGFGVVEVRKAGDLLIENGRGELVLTREAAHLTEEVAADGIISGTYSLTPRTVIVNVRLLDAASQAVLSVADIEIQRSQAINGLLMGGASPGGRRSIHLSASER